MTLRCPLQPEGPEVVLRIYGEGIATGHATFQADVPSWEVGDSGHLPEDRWVAGENGVVLGWEVLSGVCSRCVYAGVAEVSLYVAEAAWENDLRPAHRTLSGGVVLMERWSQRVGA